MAPSLDVARSRTYPVPLDEAYSFTVAVPLEELFDQRYGPIPPIRSTTQDGPWGTLDQVRTVHTADGGSMREHLVTADPPRRFAYELTEITGPMAPLVARVEGSWDFEAAGTGTRITWSWTIYPKSSPAALALPVFGRLWKGYARNGLDKLEDLLLASLSRQAVAS